MNRLSFELPLLAIAMVVFLPTLGFSQTTSCDQASIATLAPCLPYVEAGNTTNPGSECCTPMGSLLSSNPTCFCQLATLAKQSNPSINTTRALQVATLCKLTIPNSVSSCLAAAGAPAGSPSSTPSGVSSTPGSSGGGLTSAGNTISRSSFVGAAMSLICALLSL